MVTTVVLAAATAEGAVRAVRAHGPGAAARLTRNGVILAALTNAASGLALLATGHRPAEWLHLVYAVLALGLVPIADNATLALGSPRGKALARLAGGVTSLIVIARLFQTG